MSIHTGNLNLGGAGEIEMFAMTNCLMIAAAGNTAGATLSPVTDSAGAFECKTCNRKFHSFQALGGHRASHKKVKSLIAGDSPPAEKKPKIHACTICGQEFNIGQALGGHMRRHRPASVAGVSTLTAEVSADNSDGNNSVGLKKRKIEEVIAEAREKYPSCKRVWLGLNLKCSEDEKSEIEEGEIVEKEEEKIDLLKLELRQPINNYNYC